MTNGQAPDRRIWVWTALLSATIFVLDRAAPPYLDFSVLYIGLAFPSLWSARRSFAFVAAAVATCLVALGAVAPRAGVEMSWPLACNRLLVIIVIWGAAMLCQRWRRSLKCEQDSAVKQSDELAKAADVLREKNEQLMATRDVAVYTLAKVAESRDADTGRHLERICAYSMILANELRKQPDFCGVIDNEFLTNLRQSSPLHDIGKVSISDRILLKPGRLTVDEFNEMKRHAAIGSDILQDVVTHRDEATFLKMAIVVARCHHERFDGTGYPDGLAGNAIPLAGRIVALADVYDALTSLRCYKEAYTPEVARNMIINQSGSHFDPDVVDAFLRRFDDFLAVQHRYPAEQAIDTTWIESLLAQYCGAEKPTDRQAAFLSDFATILKAAYTPLPQLESQLAES